jgi:serine/threonine protein kinase
MKRDAYQVLEVHPRARTAVIEAAYKALMKEVHPDTGASTDGVRATEINEAYTLISDPSERRRYDRTRDVDVGKTIGQYKLLEQIAEGGFGRTYKAEHKVVGELVCIKDCSNVTLDDTGILVDECKVLWDLRHYALPAMRDLIQLDDGRVLLVMSYIPGLTLEKTIEKLDGPMEPESVMWIMERVINGLNYIHRNGVIHGDLKPQNIIVQEDKHMAVLVDFGLSLVKPTHTTQSKGFTPYYAPPEEAANKPLVPESDYYSLGMTMLYALSGGHEHVQRKMIPQDVPDEICDFIKRLIARDVNSRPQYGKIEDDLGDMISEVRRKVFGRTASGMKPIFGKKPVVHRQH